VREAVAESGRVVRACVERVRAYIKEKARRRQGSSSDQRTAQEARGSSS
jgi:hypothetical protein